MSTKADQGSWSTRAVWRAAGVPDHLGRALVDNGWLLTRPDNEADVLPLQVAAVLASLPNLLGEERPRAFRRPGLRDEKAMRLAAAAGRDTTLPVTATLLVWDDDAALARTPEDVAAYCTATDRLMGTQVLLPVGQWASQLPSRSTADQ